MLYVRQNSRINVYLEMDPDEINLAQVVPTCVYDTDRQPFAFSPKEQIPVSLSADVTHGNNQSSVAMANDNKCDEELLFNFGDATGPLAEAAKKAFLDGNVTPLVKEELKYVIQTKRLKEGKDEMKVEFTDPLPDQLTPEEEERVEKRRVQNREAAQRFRERQKGKVVALQKKCQQLETVQTQLRYELEQVRKERDELKTAFQQHMALCPLQFPSTVSTATSYAGIT